MTYFISSTDFIGSLQYYIITSRDSRDLSRNIILIKPNLRVSRWRRRRHEIRPLVDKG